MKKTEIKKGIELSMICDKKFKEFRACVLIHRPLSRGEVTKNSLMTAVMRMQSGNYPDATAVSTALEELYGADMFKIEQESPYSENYNKCTGEALDDQRRNARPKLVQLPGSVSRYDVIYLGYPNYWNTVPMAVMTFLEGTDFDGKLIKPFCTH